MSDSLTEEEVKELMEDLLAGRPHMTRAEKGELAQLKQKILPEPSEKSTDLQSHLDGTHKVFASVLNDVKLNIPAMLVGSAGCGKSTLLYQVAQKLNLTYYPMAVNGQTAAYDIIGYKNASGDYIRTAFREAYENGGLFSFEEIDAGNPNVLTVINNALSQDFYLFPDKIVQKNERFRLCASANTYGYGATRQYVGRNPLDAATLDRFAMTTVDYDEDLEKQIGPVKEWTFFVQALRSVVSCWDDRVPPIIISTRAVVLGGRDVQSGTDWDNALHKFVWRGVALKPEVIGAMKREAFKLFVKNYFANKRTK